MNVEKLGLKELSSEECGVFNGGFVVEALALFIAAVGVSYTIAKDYFTNE